MTMTTERLAELDAVMANTTKREWSADGLRDNRIVWSGPDTRVCFMAIYPKAHADSLAIVALHNAYPELKAMIDAQAATIAGLRDVLRGVLTTIENVNLNDRLCCSGQDCGCRGSTHGELMAHDISAALTGAASE